VVESDRGTRARGQGVAKAMIADLEHGCPGAQPGADPPTALDLSEWLRAESDGLALHAVDREPPRVG
jgi:hypothetical protein